MNREFLPEAVIGLTIGLLLAVLAVYRTKKPAKRGVMSRGAMIAVLLYAIVAAQVLVRDGMTFIGLLLLLVMVCLPVAGMMLAARGPYVTGTPAQVGRVLVSVGLAAAMLIAAGQTLSMLSLVDPRMLVVVLAGVTGLLVAFDGMRAAGRIGSLAVWLLIIPIVLTLALAFLLGNIGQAVSPIIRTGGLPIATVVSLMAAFLVLGAADMALAASQRSAGWSPVRVLGGVFAVVILLAFGMLMFFGGAILAPTVQFFVIPANLDALPGLAGVVLAVLTVLFAAVVASALSGLLATERGLMSESRSDQVAQSGQVAQSDYSGHVAQPEPAEDAPATPGAVSTSLRLFWIGLAAATILALINPGMEWVVIASSLAAAALATAMNARGVLIGLVLAGVLIVVMSLTKTMTWGLWAVLAVAVVAIVARVVSPRATPTAEVKAADNVSITS